MHSNLMIATTFHLDQSATHLNECASLALSGAILMTIIRISTFALTCFYNFTRFVDNQFETKFFERLNTFIGMPLLFLNSIKGVVETTCLLSLGLFLATKSCSSAMTASSDAIKMHIHSMTSHLQHILEPKDLSS